MSLQLVKDGLIQIKAAIVPLEDSGNVEEIKAALNNLIGWLPTSATYVAESEKFYNIKIGELQKSWMKTDMTATEKKMLFQGEAAEEIATMTEAERLNKALVHAMDALRSMLSMSKEE